MALPPKNREVYINLKNKFRITVSKSHVYFVVFVIYRNIFLYKNKKKTKLLRTYKTTIKKTFGI